MQARGNWKQIPEEEAVESADFYWRPVNFGFEGYHRIDKRLAQKPQFIFNHFEVLHGICTKTNLIKSLRAYYEGNEHAKKEGYNLFDTTPTTYVISRHGEDRDIHHFL